MKKYLGVLLTMTMIAGLFTGCGGKKTQGDYTNKSGLGFKALDYVTLGKYKGLDAYNVKVETTDKEVDEEVESSLNDYAEYNDITDRGAKDGDYIDFDYSTTVKGKAVEDCAYQDYEIQLGNGEFNEELEEAMLGRKPGDVFTVTTEIPEDLSETNAGDLGIFTITVNNLQSEKLPVLNEEFVKKNTDYQSVAEYREGIKNDLIESKTEDYNTNVNDQLVYDVQDASEFKKDKPKELKEVCEKSMREDAEYQAEMFGMSPEELISEFYDEGEFEEAIDEEVETRLIIYAIAETESLFYTKSALKKYQEDMAKDYEYENVDELLADYGEDQIFYEATYANVTDFLFKNANKKDVSEEEYMKLNPDLYEDEADDEDSTAEDVSDAGESEESDDEADEAAKEAAKEEAEIEAEDKEEVLEEETIDESEDDDSDEDLEIEREEPDSGKAKDSKKDKNTTEKDNVLFDVG